MRFEFAKLISTNRNKIYYESMVKYAIKQLSLCQFEIINNECITQVRYIIDMPEDEYWPANGMSEGDICEVIFNNDTSVVSLLDYLILAGDEPSPKFMYSIIGKTPQPFPPLLDVLNAYKSQYYISGEKLKNQILYKIYSRTPLTCQSRNTYNASWIDYEKQLKDGNIIYDEGITGIWAMPARTILGCFTDLCKERYGNRVFILNPIDECFYLDNGKEIIGKRYRVIKSLSLEHVKDMGTLIKYLIENERTVCDNLLSEKNREKELVKDELHNSLNENRLLKKTIYSLEKKNKFSLILGVVIGALVMYIGTILL